MQLFGSLGRTRQSLVIQVAVNGTALNVVTIILPVSKVIS